MQMSKRLQFFEYLVDSVFLLLICLRTIVFLSGRVLSEYYVESKCLKDVICLFIVWLVFVLLN